MTLEPYLFEKSLNNNNMQSNINETDNQANVGQDVNLKPHTNNVDYSTGHSELHQESVDLNEPQDQAFKDKDTSGKKPDVFTPNLSKKDKEGGDDQWKKFKFASEVKSNVKKENLSDKDFEESIKPFDTKGDDKGFVEKIKDNVELVSEKIGDVKDSVGEKISETAQNIKEGIIHTKENINSKIAEVAEETKAKAMLSKDKVVKILGLEPNIEDKIANLNDKYEKLEELKNMENIKDEDKIEKAIMELESVPLDPSHIHDDQIEEAGFTLGQDPFEKDVPEDLKAEDPDYQRAEAIREIILNQDIDNIIVKDIEVDPDNVEDAITELDIIPLDPSHAHDEYIEKYGLFNPPEALDKDIPEDLKPEDPDYRRAEAIKEIVSHTSQKDANINRGNDFEEDKYVDKDKEFDENKVEEAINKLDNIPLDPSHIHDENIEKLGVFNPPEALDKEVPEELKSEDPDYQRAEVIRELIRQQGSEFVEDLIRRADERAKQSGNSAGDSRWDHIKERISLTFSNVKETAARLWENVKEAVIITEDKLEQEFGNVNPDTMERETEDIDQDIANKDKNYEEISKDIDIDNNKEVADFGQTTTKNIGQNNTNYEATAAKKE